MPESVRAEWISKSTALRLFNRARVPVAVSQLPSARPRAAQWRPIRVSVGVSVPWTVVFDSVSIRVLRDGIVVTRDFRCLFRSFGQMHVDDVTDPLADSNSQCRVEGQEVAALPVGH